MKKTNLPKILESKSSKAYKSKKLNNANFDDFRHRGSLQEGTDFLAKGL